MEKTQYLMNTLYHKSKFNLIFIPWRCPIRLSPIFEEKTALIVDIIFFYFSVRRHIYNQPLNSLPHLKHGRYCSCKRYIPSPFNQKSLSTVESAIVEIPWPMSSSSSSMTSLPVTSHVSWSPLKLLQACNPELGSRSCNMH